MLRIVRSDKITPELLAEYIAFHHAPHVNGVKGKQKEWYRQRLLGLINSPHAACHQIRNGRHILGIAIVAPVTECVKMEYHKDVSDVKSVNIWIGHRHRRAGVATQLIKGLSEEYPNMCWTVGSNNFAAEKFIQKQGFGYVGKVFTDGESVCFCPQTGKALSILKHYFKGEACAS